MRLAAFTLALAALALTGPAAVAQTAGSSLAGYRYCGKIPNPDTGGTVRVFGRRTSCRDSRSLWKLWRRNLDRLDCNEGNNQCEVSRVHRFRCVYGGSDELIRLRCTRGDQRVRAHWGG